MRISARNLFYKLFETIMFLCNMSMALKTHER